MLNMFGTRLFLKRALNTASKSVKPVSSKKRTSLLLLSAGGAAFLTSYFYKDFVSFKEKKNILISYNNTSSDSILLDPSISPFPKRINKETSSLFKNDKSFDLLGAGVRFISVITFKLYALGIYVNYTELKKFLINNKISADDLKNMDDDKFFDFFTNSIINSNNLNTNLIAKLTPLRDTDFTHLRKSMIRAIKKHPSYNNYKEQLDKESDDFLKLYQKKGKLAKNDDFFIELIENGNIKLSTFNNKKNTSEVVGILNCQYFGKLLFSNYISNKNGPSEAVREASKNKMISLLQE